MPERRDTALRPGSARLGCLGGVIDVGLWLLPFLLVYAGVISWSRDGEPLVGFGFWVVAVLGAILRVVARRVSLVGIRKDPSALLLKSSLGRRRTLPAEAISGVMETARAKDAVNFTMVFFTRGNVADGWVLLAMSDADGLADAFVRANGVPILPPRRRHR